MFALFCRFAPLALLCVGAFAADAVYLDTDGTWKKVKPYQLKNAHAKTTFVSKRAISWSITYEDVDTATGIGFDDAALGETRRNTLESVVSYISSVLTNDGSLDIHVLASQNVGSGTTALAQAGPFFDSGISSFQGGFAFTHITTGVDPLPGTADMQVLVDFGYNYNSDTDTPASNEFDLFTILLHEITHGLGMVSSVQADGSASLLSNYDAHLKAGTGQSLFDADGNFIGTSSMLVGASQGVVFGGPAVAAVAGGPVPVYSPLAFLNGSSLSHWCAGDGASSMQPQNFAGTVQRSYAPYELAMLSDLGYSVNQTHELVFPWVSNSADFSSTIVVNNTGSTEATFSLTGVRPDGSSFTSANITLDPGGFYQEAAATAFPDLNQGPGLTVTLTSTSANLVGRWVTNDNAAETPSQGLAVRRTIRPTRRAGHHINLGYLPGNANFQSAPVLVNMGDTDLDIDVYFFDAAGNKINELSFGNVAPLTPQIVTIVGADAGDQYAVAVAEDLITGAVFVFNSQNQTAIGNSSTLDGFVPPQ